MKRQSKQSKITIKSALCVLLIIGGIGTFSSMCVNATTVSYEPSSYSSLIPHAPISITSDSDFEVFPGSGTAEDPYVIEGYNITTTSTRGISITDTTKHFIICNCYVDAESSGIYIDNVTNGTTTIENNLFSYNYYGIFLEVSGSSTFTNNTFSYNNYGIWLRYSDSPTVINNTFSYNNDYYGIYFYDSSGSIVVNNTFSYNYGDAIYIQDSNSSTVVNNTCNNNDYGIQLIGSSSSTVANNTCNYNNQGIYLGFCSGSSTVVNNTCNYNNGNGIMFYYSSGSTISNNTCNYNNAYGINLYTSSGSSTVINNMCSNNNISGIFLRESNSSTVVNNTCSYNEQDGIYLSSSGSSTVSKNTFTNNYRYGIHLSASSSTISNNTCSYNSDSGIYLYGSSGSTISNNTCSNNNYGILLYYSDSSTISNNMCSNNNLSGIYIDHSDYCVLSYNLLQESGEYGIYLSSYSDNNTIHHNNFVDNNLGGTSQGYDDGANNYWYNTETQYGNDWSDWSGTGSYDIDGSAGSEDLYPLGESVDIDPPVITNIIHSPSTPTELDTVSITATVTDAYGVQSVTLHYRVNGGTWIEVSMNLISSDLYSGTIGSFVADYTIEYYITAVDNSINHNEATEDNGGLYYIITVGSSDFADPTIDDIVHSPASPTELDTICINATITDDSGVQSVTLHYRVNGETWIEVSMTLISGDLYSVTIGSFTIDDTIEYYITAIDNSVNHNEAIENNNGYYYNLFVGSSDVSSPFITDIILSPSTPTELDTVSITATVTDASGVQSVTLHYRVNSGTWLTISMTLVSGDLYSGTIGSFVVDYTIEYYISALDNSISHNEAIDDNSGEYHSFTILSSEDETMAVMFSFLLPMITVLFLGFGIVVLKQRKV